MLRAPLITKTDEVVVGIRGTVHSEVVAEVRTLPDWWLITPWIKLYLAGAGVPLIWCTPDWVLEARGATYLLALALR